MSINAQALIDKFQTALTEGWGYIWGAAGETWTQAKQNAATRDMTVKYGKKWIGKRVADCSGLFAWAFKQLGGTMYHGSNTMYKSWSVASGAIAGGKKSNGQSIKPGSAVYKYNTTDGYHHVGLYIGNGDVIEAKGTQSGVIKSSINSGWTHWSELKGVIYGDEPAPVPEPAVHGAGVVTAASGSSVRMRATPSTSGKIMTNVPIGAAVNVLSVDGDWAQIEYTRTGYMMKKYIKENK